MRCRFFVLTGLALLALAPACSGVDGAPVGIRSDGGAPDVVVSSSGSASSSGSDASSPTGSPPGSTSSGGGARPDASFADDASRTQDSGDNEDSGAVRDAGLPPLDGGSVVCPDDPVHAQEAVAAIATGNPVTCDTLTCPGGQCCFVQPSPYNVCVAR